MAQLQVYGVRMRKVDRVSAERAISLGDRINSTHHTVHLK